MALLVNSEVLLQSFAADAIGDAVLMEELSGLQLQTHRWTPIHLDAGAWAVSRHRHNRAECASTLWI